MDVDERLTLPMPYVGLFIVAAVSYTEISVASVPVEITQSLLHTASRPVHIFDVAGFALVVLACFLPCSFNSLFKSFIFSYKITPDSSKKSIKKFTGLGYEIKEYVGYFGHSYYRGQRLFTPTAKSRQHCIENDNDTDNYQEINEAISHPPVAAHSCPLPCR